MHDGERRTKLFIRNDGVCKINSFALQPTSSECYILSIIGAKSIFVELYNYDDNSIFLIAEKKWTFLKKKLM